MSHISFLANHVNRKINIYGTVYIYLDITAISSVVSHFFQSFLIHTVNFIRIEQFMNVLVPASLNCFSPLKKVKLKFVPV